MCEVFFAVLAALLVFSALKRLLPLLADFAAIALLNWPRQPEEGVEPRRDSEPPRVRVEVPQPRPKRPAAREPLPPVSERLSGLVIRRDGDRWRVGAYHFRTREEAEDYVRERERICRGEG
jgi:hypothetical protein